MYYGEAHTALDDKGRLSIPVQFRKIMDVHDHDLWYLTRGFDGAIFLFHRDRWNGLLEQSQGFAPLDPDMLDFRRLFLGSVAKAKLDRQWRLVVPAPLRAYAGIEREGVLLGVEDHLELWSRTGWEEFQRAQAARYKEMAGLLFGSTRERAAETEGAV